MNKKKAVGAYVKVFVLKAQGSKFYRDGYTDMTGSFKYALSDLDGINEFAILALTEKGGVIERVKPPSQLNLYDNAGMNSSSKLKVSKKYK